MKSRIQTPSRLMMVGCLLAAGAGHAAGPSAGVVPPQAPMDVFAKLDRDGDQFLTDAEAGADENVLKRFAQLDGDNDRRISSAEYAAAVAPDATPPSVPPFQRLDTDRDGSLSADELMAPPGEGRRLMELDSDRDGRVSAEEYLKPVPTAPPAAAPATPPSSPNSSDKGSSR